MLPPFSWGEAATNWQFAPIVTAFTALVAAAYLWGVLRVRRRHPRRPWPLGRTIPFLLGLLVINVATQSGVGTYDDTLFWDHMIQHLMLIMIAPLPGLRLIPRLSVLQRTAVWVRRSFGRC